MAFDEPTFDREKDLSPSTPRLNPFENEMHELGYAGTMEHLESTLNDPRFAPGTTSRFIVESLDSVFSNTSRSYFEGEVGMAHDKVVTYTLFNTIEVLSTSEELHPAEKVVAAEGWGIGFAYVPNSNGIFAAFCDGPPLQLSYDNVPMQGELNTVSTTLTYLLLNAGIESYMKTVLNSQLEACPATEELCKSRATYVRFLH